ncbi:MAG: hypothetical protein CLLPBCKN_000859 [Chroococcidiopsis cubana SAG 39.79]|uniref:Uncharacterized protein n=1 Tax=Chroococcidiopsis cubana SAG 39.79 TaxID=388085 RepID=A0AB37UH87_9CYAN|nr:MULTISPECIES: hypothetical protein [Chroococcidiopsis]MBE9019058.1 hypothetical protein [Chroococcidiopsidales cyanobacterium LEGE 13417]PSB40893.1 hypothetical protein C7B80_32290 [Cyanosarcina cf. burmensis CCALA 770]MDZ4871471.1 hypothetical protein [Chroococcidiopsis cubana SAG 39.79]PSB52339.1 hypothetical protein C7B79_35950 [Chroococcidiopsis cubana CCALA 043]PSM50884.1 hypothetical protein C7Y66_01535 [Chroococcidiopsis sp. CCALA 051]
MTDTQVKTLDEASKKQAFAPQPQVKQSVSNCYMKRVEKKVALTRGVEGSLNLSTSLSLPIPRFRKRQMVRFIGGIGTIENCRASAGAWLYMVEMAQGPEPEMGRIGPETTIVLYEADLQAVIN